MRPISPFLAGLAMLALASGSPAAQARTAQPGVSHEAVSEIHFMRDTVDSPAPYAAAFPIAGVTKRDGAYYLDLDMAALEHEGFDTYATVGGTSAGFARLSAGLVTSAPLSGALFDGWTMFGMTGYGHRNDTSALRTLETGNQWVGGLGLGYRF